MKLYQILGFIFFTLSLLVGCKAGGSSSGNSGNYNESTKLGIIVDSQIIGLRYISINKNETKTKKGITNSKGEFEYFEDGISEFFVGNIKLVSTKPSKMIAITTVARTEKEAENIARFLQTIDEDGNPDNGIQIPSIVDKNAVSNNLLLNFDDSFDANFDNIKYLLYSHTVDTPSTVSAKQALEHSSKSARLSSLNEYDLYKAIANEKNYRFKSGFYNADIFENNQRKRVYLWIWENVLLNEMTIEDELQFSIPKFDINNVEQTRNQIKKYLDYVDAVQGVISLGKGTYKNITKAKTQSFSYEVTQLTSLSVGDCSAVVKLNDTQTLSDENLCQNMMKILNPVGDSTSELLVNPILSKLLPEILPKLLHAKKMNWLPLNTKSLKTISKLKVSKPDVISIASSLSNISNKFYGVSWSSDINEELITRILVREWLSIKFRSGFEQDYMNLLINNNSTKLTGAKEQIEALALKLDSTGALCDTYKSFIPFYECTGAENINYNYNKVIDIINEKLLKSNALYKNITDLIGSISDEKGNIGTAVFDWVNEGNLKEKNNQETFIIKKTGQTKSYNIDGNEVQDNSLSDDGYYQKGVEQRYTRSLDIVTDDLTKLMWQDNKEAKAIKKQWLTDKNYITCKYNRSSQACFNTSGDTATSYCSNLNLNGYADWRLPSSVELESIIDYSKFYPAINIENFKNISSSRYWSSTSYNGNKDNAWSMSFFVGYVFNYKKHNSFNVRCVRAGQ